MSGFQDQTRADREFNSFREDVYPLTKRAVTLDQADNEPLPVFPSYVLPTGFSREESFNKISAAASGVEYDVLNITYTDDAYLYKIFFGGTNKATYKLYLNTVLINQKVTYFFPLNDFFDYGYYGLKLINGDNIKVTAEHARPSTCDFYSSFNGIKK